MSVANQITCYTIVAGADLSGCQYTGVKFDGTLGGTSPDFEGILQNKPKSGEHATVCFEGITKALVGSGGGVAGIKMSVTTSGYFTQALSGGHAVGRCIIAAASGGLATVRLFGTPSYVSSV
jgi:hypothetical protein